MPTSALPKRYIKATPRRATRSRSVWPFFVLVGVAVVTVCLIALPASMLQRTLPAGLHAEDFSGTLWHGSAGKLWIDARNAGAVEWRIQPWSLLSLTVSADVRWVKVAFVGNAHVTLDRHGFTARDAIGQGPVEDLSDLGLPPGLRGNATFSFNRVTLSFADAPQAAHSVTLQALVGDVVVADLSSAALANGSALGGYRLHLANGAITPDADATGELTDTGGPLELNATLRFVSPQLIGTLSGTVKERPGASAALRSQVEMLTQMHARDAEGRIPVELEFAL